MKITPLIWELRVKKTSDTKINVPKFIEGGWGGSGGRDKKYKVPKFIFGTSSQIFLFFVISPKAGLKGPCHDSEIFDML